MSDRCIPHGIDSSRCLVCNMNKPRVGAAPAEMDEQAKAAVARLTDTAPVEVDYGTFVGDANSEDGIEKFSVASHVDEVVKRVTEPLLDPDPPIAIPKPVYPAGNPIVDAAAAYTKAQEDFKNYTEQLEEAETEVRYARERLETARGDRDLKKQVLQSLVGGVG